MQAKTVTSVASQTRAPTGDGPQVFQTRKQYSVLAMNTIAFTINFAVWTMFSVIGIRIKSELGLNETEFGLLVATPILDRLADPPAARYSHRPLWRSHRLFPANALCGGTDLWFGLRHGILAVPDHRSVRRHGRRLVRHRYRLHLRVVPERATRHRHGDLRRRQRRNRAHQPCSTIDHRRLGLARSAAGVTPSPCW